MYGDKDLSKLGMNQKDPFFKNSRNKNARSRLSNKQNLFS